MQRQATLPSATGVFQFVAAGDASEIAREIETFDLTLFWSLAALALGLIVAIFIQVQYGHLNDSPLGGLRMTLALPSAEETV